MSSELAREEVIWPGVRARWFETEHEPTVDANAQPMLQITARLQGLGCAVVSLPLAAMFLYSMSQNPRQSSWWLSEYKLLGVSLWALLGYACVVVAVNRITITVNRKSLVIRHSPLPWRPTRIIPIELVDLAYPRIVQGGDGPAYFVAVLTHIGADKILLSAPSRDGAQRVCNLMNHWISRARQPLSP